MCQHTAFCLSEKETGLCQSLMLAAVSRRPATFQQRSWTFRAFSNLLKRCRLLHAGPSVVMGNSLPQVPGLSKAAYSSLVTKIWKINVNTASAGTPAASTVILRHNRRMGEKFITVDGEVVHSSRDLLDSGGVVQFTAAGRDCVLTVVDYPGLSSYELRVGGEVVPSEAETLHHHSSSRATQQDPEDEQQGHHGWRLRVTVPQCLQAEQEGGSSSTVAYFVVRTELLPTVPQPPASPAHQAAGEEGGEACGVVEVRRRFQDFDDLDAKVRSYFHQHHLRSSLPSLPPKFLKRLTDHRDAAFLEQRRNDLQVYLSKLCGFPHMAGHPDLMDFLGLQQSGHTGLPSP